MQQLTGMDASFLYLETAKSPMHVGGVYIFAPPEKGQMNFQIFKDYIASRLHTSRTFRQRIVESPLNLGHPYWIEDPEFNLNNHLYHTSLPQPAGRKELRELAAQSFSRTLDRKRPLWELIFVEGLDNMEDVPKGSFALISKVHHAAIDGVSGAEMMGALLDLKPDAQKKDEDRPWRPERLPGSLEILAKNYWQVFGTPYQFAKFAYETVVNTVSVAKEVIDKALQAPAFPFTAPATPFNVTISSNRVFGGAELSLEKLKEIKNKVEGATLNDVVLAVCSGAFRKYLEKRKELPKKSLIAMAPISVRAESEKGEMGNKVSAMLVTLATNEADPIRRLKLIHESSRTSKAYSKAIGATQLMDFIPSTLAALGSRLYTSLRLSERHNAFFNMVITNVPGPPVPLYLNGAKMLALYGTAPILDSLGLLLVVFSYAGTISISFTSTPEIIPETDVLRNCMMESMDELYTLIVGKEEKKKPEKTSVTEKINVVEKIIIEPKIAAKVPVKRKKTASSN